MTKPNELVCSDTVYGLSPAYIKGALACRHERPHWNNPYDDETQDYYDWDYGHVNEAAGEHYRFGKDLIKEPPEGKTFEEDQNIPRDEHGDIPYEFIAKQAAALA